MHIREIERRKKAAALPPKGKGEEEESNRSDLEGVRKRDSGKFPEGSQKINTGEVNKTEPPKNGVESQRDDDPNALRGARTATLLCAVVALAA